MLLHQRLKRECGGETVAIASGDSAELREGVVAEHAARGWFSVPVLLQDRLPYTVP